MNILQKIFSPKKNQPATRLPLKDVIEQSPSPEYNQAHLDDWHFCTKGGPFIELQKLIGEGKSTFSFTAAQTAPKSIRYRQRNCEFNEDGKPGDYLFMDRSGGRLTVPYILFKRLFS